MAGAVPARSLALGAAMIVVMLAAGWALARSIPALARRRGGGDPGAGAVPVPSAHAPADPPRTGSSVAPRPAVGRSHVGGAGGR